MKTRLLLLLRLLLPYRRAMALALLLGFLTIGSGMGLMMTSAYLIAKAALHPSVAELQAAVVGVRFFGITRAVFRYLERLISHNLTLRLLAGVRIWFFRAVEPSAPARLSALRSGDLLSRVITDVESLQNFYVRLLAPPIVAGLICLMMGGILSTLSLRTAAVVLLNMSIAGIFVPCLTLRSVRGIGHRLTELEARLSVAALDGLQGLADLSLYGRAAVHFDRLNNYYNELVELERKQKTTLALHESLIGLLQSAALISFFLAAVPLIHAGQMSGISLAVSALAILAAFEAIVPLPSAVLHLEQIDRSAARLFEILDVCMLPESSISPPPGDFSITFESVTFRYARTDPPVLHRFSLHIPHGDRIVIFGPNGCGKSTLIHLLHRFWEIDEGQIRIGGVPIEEFSQQRLSEWMAVSPQQVFLFSGTIRDNLLIAEPSAGKEEIERVCTAANLSTWITSLPQGYDTAVGEGGMRLSGGERRRLAIARALLKDAPILILDEPTADADAETEAALWRTFASLPGNRTVIVITHRFPAAAQDTFRIFSMGRDTDQAPEPA